MSKKLIGMFAALTALSDLMLNAGGSSGTTRIEDINFTPKQAPLPKGCKYYWFSYNGECESFTEVPYRTPNYVVYETIASSDKVAINKFNKWKQKQLNNE